MNKKTFLLVLAVCSGMYMRSQTPEMFEPYQPTALRMPSVPLIVSDPYFSIWSPFDKLNEGSSRHWTNAEKPIDGLLRVDGVTYCFMGIGSHEVLESIVPMADEGAWTAKMTRRHPADGWEKADFNDSDWREAQGAFGSRDQENVNTLWDQTNSDIYVRRSFDLTAEEANDDINYVRKYWDILTLWTTYLVEYGKDPANQLCTDDFKGFRSRNSNLAVKATMGIAAYAEMCKMLGNTADYDKYMNIAREYAHYFVDHAKSSDGKFFRMEFDGPDTGWSLKYNMVWDQLWDWNLYNDKYTGDVIGKEIAFYLKKINKYGLPLDSRDDTTKGDWVAWTAAMAKDVKDFRKFMDVEYKYVNETVTRWPTSDWHHTEKSDARGFRARSVLGGYWMQVLAKKLGKK